MALLDHRLHEHPVAAIGLECDVHDPETGSTNNKVVRWVTASGLICCAA